MQGNAPHNFLCDKVEKSSLDKSFDSRNLWVIV